MTNITEWQPIETAPKDGRSILVCIAGFEPSICQWITIDDESRWSIDPETFMEESHFHEYWFGTNYCPSHWMPLPNPPVADGGSE